jgi:pimeloyl-ACP methyl ester carboxylesterase
MPRRMLALPMLLVLCLSEGCTRFQSFRPLLPIQGQDHPVCREGPQKTCGPVPLIETSDYLLGFVELDDLGWFWDRQQKQAVVEAVRNVAQSQDVIIVVFAHGWNHDSSETDSNVVKFRQVLGRLALLEGESARVRCQTARRVVGVYLGWRGKAFRGAGHFPATLYNWTSFFSRKATAHRVGAEDAAELLADLEAVRTRANSRVGNDQRASRMVVIGHSFGAAVVYGAVSRILAERRLHLEEGDVEAAAFGDLVVLVNPAIEASLLFPFEQATESYKAAREVTPFHPVLAVFASQGDGPNRVLFPIARNLTTLFKKHRRDQPPGFPEPSHFQGRAARTAAGQFEPTISFLLCPKDEKRDRQSFRCTRSQSHPPGATEDEKIEWKQAVNQQLEKLRLARPMTAPFRRGERDDLPLSSSTLFRLRPGPMSPYPIISVDDRLIPGHNEIFTDFFAPFLIDFVSVWVERRPSLCPGEQKTNASGSAQGEGQ